MNFFPPSGMPGDVAPGRVLQFHSRARPYGLLTARLGACSPVSFRSARRRGSTSMSKNSAPGLVLRRLTRSSGSLVSRLGVRDAFAEKHRFVPGTFESRGDVSGEVSRRTVGDAERSHRSARQKFQLRFVLLYFGSNVLRSQGATARMAVSMIADLKA